MADSATAVSSSTVENATTIATTILSETTTLLNNLTSTAGSVMFASTPSPNNNSFPNVSSGEVYNSSVLQQPFPSDDGSGIHKNPELQYVSTVIIICMGLAILIVPVFCFIGVVCARARLFKTVREVAGRGWGFGNLGVPYTEFGSDDVPKSSSSSTSQNCDVKILVADDNSVPSGNALMEPTHPPHQYRSHGRSTRRGSFLRPHPEEDEDDDLSSLPPTFVRNESA